MEKRPRENSIDDVFGDKTWSASQQKALISVLQRGKSVFITGPGGVGKSEIIRQIRRVMNARSFRVAVLAHTGIAALNIDGQTIYSFMHFNPENAKKTKEEISAEYLAKKPYWVREFQSYKSLIIDEISMVDPQDFEKMDWILQQTRRDYRPFGGLQLILVGDFHQLPPPVLTGSRTFVFESPSFFRAIEDVIELKEMWRQKDPDFVSMLHRLRIGKPSPEDIQSLNDRVGVNLESAARGIKPTCLYPRNADVDSVNQAELEKLTTQEAQFELKFGKYPKMRKVAESDSALIKLLKGMNAMERVSPFDKIDKLTDYNLKVQTLKIGAQVMLTYNLDIDAGLVNGTRGIVIGFGMLNKDKTEDERRVFYESDFAKKDKNYLKPDETLPIVRFTNGVEMEIGYVRTTLEHDGVEAYAWQVGLKLAWATTIHKSQGLTLDAVETDISGCFDTGMAYVALSRVIRLDALTLKTAVNATHFRANPAVISFYEKPWVMHKALTNAADV
jgi:ATP-dependent DNA helicase PIF1